MRTAILTEGKLFFDMALDIIKKAQGWVCSLSKGQAKILKLALEHTWP